jgi:trimethylamine--corrinoid protein Co-methyltransferase
VIDDEIIGMARKVLQGISVDDEHLALDTIDSVGPGGNYMMESHTMTHMREECFTGNGVTDRLGRPQWERDGSQDARERARGIARRLLAGGGHGYLSEGMERAIRERFEILLEA